MGSHWRRVTLSWLFSLLLLHNKLCTIYKIKAAIIYCSCFRGPVIFCSAVICPLGSPLLGSLIRLQWMSSGAKAVWRFRWAWYLIWLTQMAGVDAGYWWALSFDTGQSNYMWPLQHGVFRVVRLLYMETGFAQSKCLKRIKQKLHGLPWLSLESYNSVTCAAFYCYKLVTKTGLNWKGGDMDFIFWWENCQNFADMF